MMRNNNSGYIALEGKTPLVVSTVLLIIFFTLGASTYFITVLSFTTIFFLFFFRNPEKIASEEGDSVVIAPIDGIIKDINSERGAIEITITNTVFDTHLLRSPIAGKTKEIISRHGALLSNRNRKSELLNRQSTIKIGRDDSDVTIKVMPQYLDVGFSIRKNVDEKLKIGERIGFVPLGDVMLTLPQNCRLIVGVGDALSGGESIIGYINET